MRLPLAALAALLLAAVPSAGAHHDPIHTACLAKLSNIESAWHSAGSKQQRLNKIHASIHAPSLCESEPPGPPPSPPPPPPPVAQGENLPAFHAGAVGLTYYVDAASGNDTTGDGSSGSPWQTLQKAHDYLKNTATWPIDQDVEVRLRNGTYKASSGSYTLDISFVAGARSPNANRWLIWRPDSGHSPVIENPDGTEAAKGAVRLQNTSGSNHMVFRELEVYGGDERRGAAGNGNSIAFFGSGNDNDNVEIIYNEIHGFQATAGTPSSAQALLWAGALADGLKVAFNRIYDIGTTTGTSDFQEHGLYLQGTNMLILNNLIYNIVNGYDIQFFSGSAGAGSIVAHNTLVDAEASGMILDDSNVMTVKNNIFAHHTGRGSSSFGIEFFPPGSPVAGLVDYALYHDNQGGNRSSTPANWMFTHETQADPLFVSSATDDYHLQAASPARAFADTTYSPATDLDGNPRPPGSEDAGAFQYVAGGGGLPLSLVDNWADLLYETHGPISGD